MNKMVSTAVKSVAVAATVGTAFYVASNMMGAKQDKKKTKMKKTAGNRMKSIGSIMETIGSLM